MKRTRKPFKKQRPENKNIIKWLIKINWADLIEPAKLSEPTELGNQQH